MIHWTRQIKELLNTQEALERADTAGPLEEIEFWNERCDDLSSLTTQLNLPGVLKVCRFLEKAKSSYLKQFVKLAKLIQVCTAHQNVFTLELFTAFCSQITHIFINLCMFQLKFLFMCTYEYHVTC